MAPVKQREFEFSQFPKFAECYKRAFKHMLDGYTDKKNVTWENEDDVFNWWLYGEAEKTAEQAESLF